MLQQQAGRSAMIAQPTIFMPPPIGRGSIIKATPTLVGEAFIFYL